MVSLNKEPPPPTALDNEIAYRISQTVTRLGALSRRKSADSESKDFEQSVRKVIDDFVSSDMWLALNREYRGFSTLHLLSEFRNELRIPDEVRSLDLMIADISSVDTWAAMRRVSFANPTAIARAFVGQMVSPPMGADAAIRLTARWRNTDFPYTDCSPDRPFC